MQPTTNKEVVLQFFRYEHLPSDLQEVSKPFAELADIVYETGDLNPQRQECLNKLLEAKDCAVRAFLYKRKS